MRKHILDSANSQSKKFTQTAWKFECESRPRKASLTLQRRGQGTNPARRVQQFVAIDKGRQV